jgi:hypothetical protein
MRALIATTLMMGLALAGCEATPAAKTYAVAANTATAKRIEAALSRWPNSSAAAIKRPFFATIHSAGKRTTASGMLEYHNARDFRLIAATEMGAILFDGRVNWAGVTVLRSMPGLDKNIVEILLKDMSRAFELPPNLDGLSLKKTPTLEKTLADTHKYTWTFDPATGHLASTQVELGLLDTLRVDFKSYNARGWPEDVEVTRKARFLDVSFSFTDNNVVQGNLPQSARGENGAQ